MKRFVSRTSGESLKPPLALLIAAFLVVGCSGGRVDDEPDRGAPTIHFIEPTEGRRYAPKSRIEVAFRLEGSPPRQIVMARIKQGDTILMETPASQNPDDSAESGPLHSAVFERGPAAHGKYRVEVVARSRSAASVPKPVDGTPRRIAAEAGVNIEVER
ncbi:hypothetical protein [Planctomyces sp. SH-PL62]|uniref:hypothetical protein n=1 Tax=Planctomyces sp. SH-PL62 TaxID=1636152 RepID=UPI00078B85AF|nr:hypothetical protein [Planctomyces sp. SH-PL62]AMV37303.1 hypothetical protein VT85_07710 [Planctomyces sp. SH-PL62]